MAYEKTIKIINAMSKTNFIKFMEDQHKMNTGK